MGKTSIEWTKGDDGSMGETWNPVRGCTKISPGCTHCYAETFAERWRGIPGHPYEQGFDLRLVPDKLTEPLSWKKPRRVFVNSMSDLFHKDVPDEFIDRVFATMAMCPQHTFQCLTKRPERMRTYMQNATREGGRWDHDLYDGSFEWPTGHEAAVDIGYERITSQVLLSNVWLGVSVEDQQRADERIPVLLQTPAAVRFLSCEPLLAPIDFRKVPGFNLAGSAGLELLRNLWVIVGGESGPGARPCDISDIRSLVDQCRAASVPCFVKQLGSRPFELEYRGNGRTYTREAFEARGDVHDEMIGELGKMLESARYLSLRDKKGSDMAEWPANLQVREFPQAVPS